MSADFTKGHLLYEGKAKRIYSIVGKSDVLWQEFKDSLTAFNALKRGEFENKGALNRDVTSLVFRYLNKRGVQNHWAGDIGARDMATEKLEMLKIEVVVRNKLAGSTAKKFGIAEGSPLEAPLVEFFYKDDRLGDPFISDEQALMLKIVPKQNDLNDLKTRALEINRWLLEFFGAAGLDLIDFKVEFGRRPDGSIVLADEITPDSCRLWDQKTSERMDKDRFRRDLGGVKDAYEEVCSRLKTAWEKSV